MSDKADWLITTPIIENNVVNVYNYNTATNAWEDYKSVISRLGAASTSVSVAISNYEGDGRLAVAVGPSAGPDSSDVIPGETLIMDLDSTIQDIDDKIVEDSDGSVAMSQDGRFLATWATNAGVYDVDHMHLCYRSVEAEYDSLQVPFALSRLGGYFAEATNQGVVLFEIISSAQSCTVAQKAFLRIDSVQAVALGGDDWLAVVGYPHDSSQSLDSSLSTPKLLVYSVQELVAEPEAVMVV